MRPGTVHGGTLEFSVIHRTLLESHIFGLRRFTLGAKLRLQGELPDHPGGMGFQAAGVRNTSSKTLQAFEMPCERRTELSDTAYTASVSQRPWVL